MINSMNLDLGLQMASFRQAAAPPTLGPYLPGTPFFAGSVSKRLVAGFNGPAVLLVRVNDLAEQSFNFKLTDDYLDLAAILTWAGASEIAVKEVYDHGGSARKLVQTTLANMPRFVADADNNFAIIANDHTEALNNSGTRGMRMSGLSIDRQICSIFLTERAYFNVNRCVFELSTAAVSDLYFGTSTTGVVTGGATLPTAAFLKTQVETKSVVTSATEIVARIASQVYAGLAPVASKLSTGFNLWTRVSDSSKYAAADIYAAVIYDTTRSDAADIHALLATRFGEVSPRARRVIFDGDSLTCSYGTKRGRNASFNKEKLFVPRVDVSAVGTYGFRYASSVTAVATRVGNIARAGNNDVVVVRLGTNDSLADSQTGAQIMTRCEAYITQLRTVFAGKIVVCTIPPGYWNNPTKEQDARDFNALLIANAASMGVYVARNDTNAAFNAACYANDSRYCLGVHYTEEGYRIIDLMELSGINAALAAV